jgi:hypothetical protein
MEVVRFSDEQQTQITVAPLRLPDIKPPGAIALDRMVVRAVGELAQVSQSIPSRWHAGSNDQYEQRNDAYSDHQHGKC